MESKGSAYWEIDTVIGSGPNDCIVTIVQRRSGYLLIGKLNDRTSTAPSQRVIQLIRSHRKHFPNPHRR